MQRDRAAGRQQREKILETPRDMAWSCVSQLGDVTILAKVRGMSIRREAGLQCARERHLAIRRGPYTWQSGLSFGYLMLSLEMRLLHRRRQIDVLPLGTIILFTAIHTALSLLSGSEWFQAKVHAQLARRFSGSLVLHCRGSAEQRSSEIAHGSCESCSCSTSEPLDGCTHDTMTFPMSVCESTTLRFQRSLNIRGTRRDARLQ